jgi:hypothetical protein
MRKKLFSFLLLFLLTKIGFAQDWIYVGNSTSGISYYIRNSAVTETGYKRVWSKQLAKVLSYQKKGKTHKLTNGYCLELREYDCDSKQIKLISWAYYNARGEVVHSVNLQEYETEWVDVIPDSIGELLLNQVCELL